MKKLEECLLLLEARDYFKNVPPDKLKNALDDETSCNINTLIKNITGSEKDASFKKEKALEQLKDAVEKINNQDVYNSLNNFLNRYKNKGFTSFKNAKNSVRIERLKEALDDDVPTWGKARIILHFTQGGNSKEAFLNFCNNLEPEISNLANELIKKIEKSKIKNLGIKLEDSKKFVNQDIKTKKSLLKKVIQEQQKRKLSWEAIKTVLGFKENDTVSFIEEVCRKTSPGTLNLFNIVRSNANKQYSQNEQWFYDVLVEKFNEKSRADEYAERLKSGEKYIRQKNNEINSAGLPNKLSDYRDKVILSNLDEKEFLEGSKSVGGRKQDIDILITFKNSPQKYNGVNIDGIGIACDGELFHKHSINNSRKMNTDYDRTVANDYLRLDNKTYFIIPWDEKDITVGSSEEEIKERARQFIDKNILDILSNVFSGNRPIYNPTQHQKQGQDIKLKEIADALHKIGKFEYSGENGRIEIKDLGIYFLFNKYNLAPQPNKDYLWSKPTLGDFEPDENWKAEIYKSIINNEKLVREKGLEKTLDFINKHGKYPTKGNSGEYGKHQPARQFAKLFKEIKRRTSK